MELILGISDPTKTDRAKSAYWIASSISRNILSPI